MFDYLITGGEVLDGSGAPARPADVGITRGRVALLPRGTAAQAREVVDASGLLVCPGFIDVHSHSDVSLLTLPDLHDKILQGVTTEVIGNCGISAFPVGPGAGAGAARAAGGGRAAREGRSGRAAREGRSGRAAREVREVLQAVAPDDFTLDWTDAAGYFSALGRAGLETNVVALVGHGTLRAAVIGLDGRPAAASELEEMADLLRACLDAGAAGLSFGLLYPPGCYADRNELTHLAAVVAGTGGVVSCHMRDYQSDLLGSLEEMFAVARATGARVEISHLMAPDVEAAEAALRLFDRAEREGLEVFFDQYPYDRGMTSLQTLLPPWLLAGGTAAMLAGLASTDARDRAARDMAAGLPGWDSLVRSVGWGDISLVEPTDHPWSGRSFAEIAETVGRPAPDCLFDLLAEAGGNGSISMKLTDEAVLRLLMRSPRQCFGTDGVPRRGLTHPRTFGTYPRVMGLYVRERGVLDSADAVRRCTAEPARRFGLKGRGLLGDGAHADLVVFDPRTVEDRATYRHTLPPSGIRHVFVGGRPAVADGRVTGVKAGRLVGCRGQ